MTALWEGLDLRPAHRRWRFWLAVGRDELPETRTSSDLIPFRRGRLHLPGTADTRPLELRGYIKELTDPAMRGQLDYLKSLLDPERLEPGRLEDDFEDGSHRWITAAPQNVIARYAGEAGRLFSIELVSLDPFWYRSWGEWTLDSGLYLDTGLFLDEGLEVVANPTSQAEDVTFGALGSAENTKVRVEVDGPSIGPVTLDNVTFADPPGLTFPALAAGQTLVVDAGLAVVTLNGVQARASLSLRAGNRHGEYFRLRPGLNTVSIGGRPAEVRLSFPATYL